MAQRFKFYAVRVGVKPDIYTSWYGIGQANEQIEDYPGPGKPEFKGFNDRASAEAFLRGPDKAAESYEKLLQKYLDGDTSVLPRLEKLAQAMNGKANGNSASSATHSRQSMDRRPTRTRNAGYAPRRARLRS